VTGGSGGAGGAAAAGGEGGAGGSGGAAAGGAGGGGAGTAVVAGECPTTDLGSDLPIVYEGDTTGLANIAESERLEWRDAPDAALLFTAPADGRYRVTDTNPTEDFGCGASVWDYGTGAFYDASWCPSSGGTATLDGYFGEGDDIPLMAGETLLIWYSCSYWSNLQTTPFTITIEAIM
jgi:hypothetical protein